MPKPSKNPKPETLKGWQQIAAFLGEPVSVVQRWASEGMPVHKEGRFVSTSVDELNAWLGRESGKPVHAATKKTDLTAELKRGLSYIRDEHQSSQKKEVRREERRK
jgi:phage terminase Nu1 subunit (DNA packaging protein)